MTFHLYRKNGDGDFEQAGSFHTYRAAVLAGQSSRGRFYVEGPREYIPSRTEQLLQTMRRPQRQTISSQARARKREMKRLGKVIARDLAREGI